jgi:RNA polymerase sigma factor (sigma-70 family)
MTKKEALAILWSNYDLIKQTVFNIESKYIEKGMYHEDLTHDLYIKIQNEIDKIPEEPTEVKKFLDRYWDGHSLSIYKMVKHMFIDMIRRENKSQEFNIDKMSKKEIDYLVNESKDNDFDNTIQQDMDKYVDTLYWFDKNLFNLYRYEFKAHKGLMAEKTKLSLSTIYRTVKRCKVKINKKLKDQYYEQKNKGSR